MAVPSLQDGIDQAGSPVRLLWKPGSAPWTPEVIEPEYPLTRSEPLTISGPVDRLSPSPSLAPLTISGLSRSAAAEDLGDT